MVGMLVVFLIVSGSVGVLALRNRLSLKLGLRNIPRRRAQTVLIVVGLMLSTTLITSALGTGDTMTYSVRTGASASLGRVDEIVTNQAGAHDQRRPAHPTCRPRWSTACAAARRQCRSGRCDRGGAGNGLTDRPDQPADQESRSQALGIPADCLPAFGGSTTTAAPWRRIGHLGHTRSTSTVWPPSPWTPTSATASGSTSAGAPCS